MKKAHHRTELHLIALGCLGLLIVGLSTGLSTPAAAQVNCGATLTADTTLTPTDPVVYDPYAQPGDAPCALNGLIINSAITLDCAGLTVKGSGKGMGVKVIGTAEGAVIMNCVIDSFSYGIQLVGRGSHMVQGTRVTNSTTSGLLVSSSSNTLDGVISMKNKINGFDVRASGNGVTNSLAIENGKVGFYFYGKELSSAQNLALENGTNGFGGSLRSSSISANRSIRNNGDGFNFTGGSVTEPNSFENNIAISNRDDGMLVAGTHPETNTDGGGNKGLENGGDIQCRIAGLACQ